MGTDGDENDEDDWEADLAYVHDAICVTCEECGAVVSVTSAEWNARGQVWVCDACLDEDEATAAAQEEANGDA
jgi:hypothetical protein